MAKFTETLEGQVMMEFLTQRLSIADERLKKLEESPICNRLAIKEQMERIAQLEADVLTAIRGY